MRICMIACIFDPQSLTMMHVCMKHLFMMMYVCMMCVCRMYVCLMFVCVMHVYMMHVKKSDILLVGGAAAAGADKGILGVGYNVMVGFLKP